MDGNYGADGTQPDNGVLTPNPAAMLQAILQMDNIADHLDPAAMAQIGEDAARDYDADRETMEEWLKSMERGIELAKLTKKAKSYPFEGAANIKYPMITTAALQFNARAYPAVVPGDAVVKAKVYGSDPQGQKAARGERISAHMSWQLQCQIEEWEEETDKLLVQLPIVGTMVRKVWYDPAQTRPRCRVLIPGTFVVNQNVKNLADAPRMSELLSLFPNEVKERINAGLFRDVDYCEVEEDDKQAPEEFIEQHTRLDLDGDDYTEPYIVTIHKKSRKVARIVADFTAEDVVVGSQGIASIRRGSYFVPYQFLPSIDGGFFGTGLGILLGDISDTINGIINMMMDAGHYGTLGGGFIGSGFRIKGGAQRLKPGEWKLVEAAGGDIRSSIVPFEAMKPDATMFQLLGLLIDAGKDVSSVKDILTGDSGTKNMTATTTMALIEQGMMVFTAAYKRIFRAMRSEFKLLARINAQTVSDEEYNRFQDGPQMFSAQQDYSAADMDIVPVADPQSVTKTQQAAKAQVLMQFAQEGLVDPAVAGQRALEALDVPNPEELAPQPDPMQQQIMEMQLMAGKIDLMLKNIAIDQALAGLEKTRSETMKNVTDAASVEKTDSIAALKVMLEGLRDGLGATINGRLGAMAGQPGNGTPAGVAQGSAGPQAPGSGMGMVAGPSMA